MDGAPTPPSTPALDACIYDYLISRDMIATAQAFVEETQGTPSAPPLQISGPDDASGFLSDWWSIFWDRFSPSPGDSEYPEGFAREEKPLEMGNHFSLEEEKMQQRAATLANSNGSNSAVFSHIVQQDPVADSAVYQRFLGCTRVGIAAPGHMQQQYQQPNDGKGADDMLDLSRDVSTEKTLGITIEEVFRVKASKKMFCCSFSSDGEWLSGAGDEKKVLLWNLRNISENYSWDAHTNFITDMSFQPNKPMLATASSDKTVRLWDTSKGGQDCFIRKFVGHSSPVRSVDFHPKEDTLLCSCDDCGKVLFWKIGQTKAKPRTSQATGIGKVRFDPTGSCIASVIGNTVNLTDVQTDKRISGLQGNGDNKTVHSICWSEHFHCLASVSDDCVRVWPSQRGGHVRELSGTKPSYFRSCRFHPKYPNTLVIGGYQTITLWNFAENKVATVQPHDGSVVDLAGCPSTGMLASASHDGCVMVWR